MAIRERFDAQSVPDQSGRTALITGSNSGIGLAAAQVLAARGAHVVMACRNQAKADAARGQILAAAPGAQVEILPIDLADLSSVQASAKEFQAGHDRLDLLINNAGVMGSPWALTADGIEFQFATNHFGHFALTGLLLDSLLATPGSRVVTVSSMGHHVGRYNPNDPAGVQGHNRWVNYGTTKLDNLLFTYELERRLKAAAKTTIATAAHPGWAQSNLAANGPLMGLPSFFGRLGKVTGHFGQSTENGAMPTLFAATAPEVKGGQYAGPSGPGQQFGPPRVVDSNKASKSLENAASLWAASEELTGVTYRFG